jgi:periplasmic divalent cation tolerance protein
MQWRPRRLRLVRTTLPDERSARALADRLVAARQACCVHVGQTFSTYMWQGRRQGETEWTVEARTDPEHEEGVRAALRAGHPYEIPLVESFSTMVDKPYYLWAKSVLG